MVRDACSDLLSGDGAWFAGDGGLFLGEKLTGERLTGEMDLLRDMESDDCDLAEDESDLDRERLLSSVSILSRIIVTGSNLLLKALGGVSKGFCTKMSSASPSAQSEINKYNMEFTEIEQVIRMVP